MIALKVARKHREMQHRNGDNDGKVDFSHCMAPITGEKATHQSRLSTYRLWAKSQNADEMAKAGFYFTGEIDRVRCFHCGLALKNWEPEDVPWVEHERYNPDCDYVAMCRNMTSYTAQQSASKQAESVADEHFETLESTDDKGTIDDLNDKTPCWRGDPQVRFAMGAGYEEEIITKALITNSCALFNSELDLIDRIETLRIVENRNIRAKNRAEATNEDGASSAEEGKRRKVAADARHDSKLCQICVDAQVCIVFLPCSHLVCCPHCSPALTQCPICRSPAKARLRIFS